MTDLTRYGTTSRQIIDQELAAMMGVAGPLSSDALMAWADDHPEAHALLERILGVYAAGEPRPGPLDLVGYPRLATMVDRIDARLTGWRADPEAARAAVRRIGHAAHDS
jgi:hypothetical protein